LFKYDESKELFYNVKDQRVLQTSNNDREGDNVAAGKRQAHAKNQMWKIVYVDKVEKTRTKGTNKEFGFDINRPFYLRSKMPMQRFMTTNSQYIRIENFRGAGAKTYQ
jgi:transcription termination factor Rho